MPARKTERAFDIAEQTADYLRERDASSYLERPNAGATIMRRTQAPSDIELRTLQSQLSKPNVRIKDIGKVERGYSRQLTPQQERFAQAVLDGETFIKAHEIAYPNNMTPKQRTAEAWRLMKHPVIVGKLDQAKAKVEDVFTMNAAKIRSHVLERLLHESTNAMNDGARIRALELLGKVSDVGMFVDRKEVTNINTNPEEVKALLMDKLRTFFARNERTIDHEHDGQQQLEHNAESFERTSPTSHDGDDVVDADPSTDLTK